MHFLLLNSASFPDHNNHVLCDDLSSTQGFLTGVAETNHDEHGEYKCFDTTYGYNIWNKNCCVFSKDFGACVRNEGECDFDTRTNYCPPTTTASPTTTN